MMEYSLSFIIGYVIGSFPTAYILLKKVKKIDITNSGTGSVGAFNSFRVSSSKIIGAIVLLIDLIKGGLSAYFVLLIFGDTFIVPMIAVIAAVFSHCYSPWLKFKGGRGLATAAGGVIVVAPVVLGLWILFWVISYAFRKNIHFSNVLASVLSGATAVTSSDVLNTSKWMTNPPAESTQIFAVTFSVLIIIILSRHIDLIKSYFNLQRTNLRK